jgi:hypothetical protein
VGSLPASINQAEYDLIVDRGLTGGNEHTVLVFKAGRTSGGNQLESSTVS